MNFGNILILGDSYSTFLNYIPIGYAHYYDDKRPDTDLHRVEQTWWYQLIEESNSNLVLNDSWSGSTVCHTGYNKTDCSKSSSFVYRLNKHISEGFFEENQINTVFVFGGTNDSWADSPLGEFKTEDFSESDLFSFLPAISFIFNRLNTIIPNARIICIINSGLKAEISNGIIESCKYYNIKYVQLENIEKKNGHPTVKGMEQIKNAILKTLV